MLPPRASGSLIALFLIASACSGTLDADSSHNADPAAIEPGLGTDPPSFETDPALGPPGAMIVRRLTRTEYNNTVRDLLADTTRPADDFLVDETKLGFDNIAEIQTISPVRAEQYMIAAEQLAATATGSIVSGLACATSGDEVCAQTFIQDFGQRAYRRPLSPIESERLLAQFRLGAETRGFEGGIELVLRTMLTSANFLFRYEVGEPVPNAPGVFRPSPWELATRISYLVLGSMPDAALFEAAGQGALTTKEQVQSHVLRLMNDERARDNLRHLHTQWFQLDRIEPAQLDKDPEMFPAFEPTTGELLRRETETFLDHVIWDRADGFSALLTGNFSFMNAELAAFYGVTGPVGADFELVQLDPAQRSGLLTQAGLLARLAHRDQTSPILRGKFVREHVLCGEIPPPPPNVDATVIPPGPTSTGRERSATHLALPSCAGCHQLFDPIGLGFEHYDATGAWRDLENGQPVDATGEVTAATFDAPYDGHFDGVPDLAQRLANSPDVRACFTKQWFRFAYGRGETERDQPLLAQLEASLMAAGGNFRDLLVALTQTDAFMFRITE